MLHRLSICMRKPSLALQLLVILLPGGKHAVSVHWMSGFAKEFCSISSMHLSRCQHPAQCSQSPIDLLQI